MREQEKRAQTPKIFLAYGIYQGNPAILKRQREIR